MPLQTKPLRNRIYLFFILFQLLGMLTLDLVAFYPTHPSSPLHVLLRMRHSYAHLAGDPFFLPASASASAPWFRALLCIEGLVQLPLAAYLVHRLAVRGIVDGPAEVAGLAFACLNFVGSAACAAELLDMAGGGDDAVAARKLLTLLYTAYLPYVIVSAALAVDMYQRLLHRLRLADKNKAE